MKNTSIRGTLRQMAERVLEEESALDALLERIAEEARDAPFAAPATQRSASRLNVQTSALRGWWHGSALFSGQQAPR